MPAVARSFDRQAALGILIRPDRIAERAAQDWTLATVKKESRATQHRTSKVKFTVFVSGQRRDRPRTGLGWSDHGTYHFHAVFGGRGDNASAPEFARKEFGDPQGFTRPTGQTPAIERPLTLYASHLDYTSAPPGVYISTVP
jgi:hypothetical protein